MSVLLAIMSYPGGNETLQRHLPYFRRQAPEWIYVISTDNDTQEKPPETFAKRLIMRDSYIDGDHLPLRMIETINDLLLAPWNILILAEYDTVFFNRIRVEAMEHAVAGHRAGGKTWGSKAEAFYHNPWIFHREAAIKFVAEGREAIKEGICGKKGPDAYGTAEASPDVFFGYVCEKLGLPVQDNLWTQYSQNSFDIPGRLEEAREAVRNGIDVVHGIKTQAELNFILS